MSFETRFSAVRPSLCFVPVAIALWAVPGQSQSEIARPDDGRRRAPGLEHDVVNGTMFRTPGEGSVKAIVS